MLNKPINVIAQWDAEAQVWVAESEDVPGLVTEAETTEILENKLKIMIPELLQENGLLNNNESQYISIHVKEIKEVDLVTTCVV